MAFLPYIYIHYMCCLHYVIFFFFGFASKIVFFFCFISFNSRNLRVSFFAWSHLSCNNDALTLALALVFYSNIEPKSNKDSTHTEQKLHSELCTECEFWITNKNLLILSHESERCTEHIEYICIKIALTATKDSKRKRKIKKKIVEDRPKWSEKNELNAKGAENRRTKRQLNASIKMTLCVTTELSFL